MARLLFATFGANGWGPLRVIEQRNSIEEGHLAHVPNLYSCLLLHFYLNLNRLMVGAPSLLVFSVPTKGTLPWLLGFALVRLMSLLPAAETSDLMQVPIHEDRHFYQSPNVWSEGCGLGGRVLRYCRNVRPMWVKFNSKDTKCNSLAPFVRLGPLRTLKSTK